MNRVVWVTGLSLVTLLLGSCTSDRKASEAPAPKPSVRQVAIIPQPPVSSPPQTAKPVQGLTLPTSPTKLSIPQGRRDPFGSVAVSPVKQSGSSDTTQPKQTTQKVSQTGQTKQRETKPETTKLENTKTQAKTNSKQTVSTSQAKVTTSNQQSSKAKVTTNNQQSSSKAKVTTNNQQSSSKPKVTTSNQQSLPERQNTSQQLIPPPAPVPSTDLASAVEVKGVMTVGGKVSAIVKTPSEPSRYVSAGEYLSGGAVLVKRIDLSGDREPQVVLEQNGVEVVKAVGSNNSPIASL